MPSSLFPFMSVLACTIGALIVLLAVISLSAVGAGGAAAALFDARRAEVAALAAMRRAEQLAIDDAEARWAALDAALEARGLDAGESAFAIARRLARARRIASIRAEREALTARLAEVETEAGEVATTLDVLASRRETLPILIDPTGLARRWQPFFLECEAAGVTAHRVRDGLRRFVSEDAIAMTGELGRFLRRVRAEPGALLVLLVRPDGLGVARQVEAVAEGAGVRVARLPLPGRGELDWQLLRRAVGEG